MKRIVAREFLLLVGGIVLVLLVTLFGWLRNAWFEHRSANIGGELAEQTTVLDSLSQRTVPMHLDFLDLFEPDFIRGNCDVFLVAPFWTMHPFWTFTVDEFDSWSGSRSPLPPLDTRYIMCTVKALDAEGYWSRDRLVQVAKNCGQPASKFPQLTQMLNSSVAERKATWRPPAGSAEIYNPTAPETQMTTWNEVLRRKGVSEISIDSSLVHARSDSSSYIPLLIAVRGLLCDSIPYTALKSAFEYLKERHVLRCNFDDLLYTLQNKAVPPSQEVLDALTKQRATVYTLRKGENDSRASLWSTAQQWTIVKWAAIVLLVLVYPLRLLVLGTRWAVRVLQR